MIRPFKSLLTPLFEEFIHSRQAARAWNNTYYENLHYFDNYIASEYPTNSLPKIEMLNWCFPRKTEKGNSCRIRTTVVWNFIDYANKRGWCNIKVNRSPTNEPCNFTPHIFTEQELFDFFRECDNYVISLSDNHPTRSNILARFEIPVYFRLLFSSGMRTCEARWLNRSDVDFSTGVININSSFGSSIPQ